jgi:hypothetical protein
MTGESRSSYDCFTQSFWARRVRCGSADCSSNAINHSFQCLRRSDPLISNQQVACVARADDPANESGPRTIDDRRQCREAATEALEGNGSPRARYDRSRSISRPVGALLCDVERFRLKSADEEREWTSCGEHSSERPQDQLVPSASPVGDRARSIIERQPKVEASRFSDGRNGPFALKSACSRF